MGMMKINGKWIIIHWEILKIFRDMDIRDEELRLNCKEKLVILNPIV